jgi:hypothetical protein
MGDAFPDDVIKKLSFASGIRDFVDAFDCILGEVEGGLRDFSGESKGAEDTVTGLGPLCADLMLQEKDNPIWHWIETRRAEAEKKNMPSFQHLTRDSVITVGLRHLGKEQLIFANMTFLSNALGMTTEQIRVRAGFTN